MDTQQIEEVQKQDKRKQGSSSKNLAIARQKKIDQLKQAKQVKQMVKQYDSSDSDSSGSDSSDEEPVITISKGKKVTKSSKKDNLKDEIEGLKQMIMSMNRKPAKAKKIIKILPQSGNGPTHVIEKPKPEKTAQQKDLETIISRKLLNF